MKINLEFVKKIGKDKLIIMIIAGVVLVAATVWENGENNTGQQENSSEIQAEASENIDKYIKNQEKKLREVLCQIEGAGDVYVMITLKTGASKNILVEKDLSYEDTSEIDSAGGSRNIYTYSEDNQTVYVTDSSGKTTPYVLSEKSPEIEGVAVISEGGDNAVVKEKIINVIKALFGIDINKISVTR